VRFTIVHMGQRAAMNDHVRLPGCDVVVEWMLGFKCIIIHQAFVCKGKVGAHDFPAMRQEFAHAIATYKAGSAYYEYFHLVESFTRLLVDP
jgi:hypothetical protein